MSSPDALFAALEANPDDWATRAVLADWYEEHGQTSAAACVRWMIRQRKRPYRSSLLDGFLWFNKRTVASSKDPESNVPPELYHRLFPDEDGTGSLYSEHVSLRAAEQALHAAWERACRHGWTPDA